MLKIIIRNEKNMNSSKQLDGFINEVFNRQNINIQNDIDIYACDTVTGIKYDHFKVGNLNGHFNSKPKPIFANLLYIDQPHQIKDEPLYFSVNSNQNYESIESERTSIIDQIPNPYSNLMTYTADQTGDIGYLSLI